MAIKLKEGAKTDFLENPENPTLGAQAKVEENQDDLKLDDQKAKSDGDADAKSPPEGADDASAELQKQIEELKKVSEAERTRSEQLAKERAEAIKIAQQKEAEASRYQRQAQDSNYDAINSALAAATAAAEKAQLDIEYAIANGDPKAQADAHRRLSKSEAAIATLEAGREELEAEKKRAAEAPPKRQNQQQQRRQQADSLEGSGLPDLAKNWLRAHPEYLSDARKNAKIQALHYDVLDEGHQEFSTAYFESLEKHLGLRKSESTQQNDGNGGSYVSAPVTRDSHSSGGGGRQTRVTLTPQQKEAAKLAGITEQEYAKNLIKMNELKANGGYGERG